MNYRVKSYPWQTCRIAVCETTTQKDARLYVYYVTLDMMT